MPRKKQKIVSNLKFWLLLGGSAILLVAMTMLIVGFRDHLATEKSLADSTYKLIVMNARVPLLFSSTKQVAAGVPQENDINEYYSHSLSAELASKIKIEGHSAIFCSDRVPDDFYYMISSADAENNAATVTESFFNGPGNAITTKTLRVGYEWPGGKIIHITCL